MEFSPDDHKFMAQAIRLARRGLYTTEPNPRVGCVLVRQGQVMGAGWHQLAGEPHAERIALANAGTDAAGSTAYVTLEPCCHHGKTPPCTEGLIEAGVSRVVAAMEDPNPLVAGKGMEMLRKAGISTQSGLLEPQARALNPGFIKRMEKGIPYLRCKLAMSLDGRTAMQSGESVWITGTDARRDVQRLRARSSAILTGSGTVLHDDPSLNVRLTPAELGGLPEGAQVHQPLRVVADSALRTPDSAKMLRLPGNTLVVYSRADTQRQDSLQRAGAELLQVEHTVQGIDLQALLQNLATREINEILLEAGPTLAGAALASGLIDELIIYMAPHLMGNEARGLFNLPGLDQMTDRLALEIEDIRMVGSDLRITAYPRG